MESTDSAAALHALPDDALLSIIAACTDVSLRHLAVPRLEAVSGLGRLCEDLHRQLHRLRPLVGVHVRSLTVAQRLRRRLMCARGPWDVVLFFAGDATAVVVEQARRGRVLSIDAHGTTLAPDVASRVVPEMLGAGCSLRALDLSHADLRGVSMWATWAATFGEAAVCSRELREMRLDGCQLCGTLPEMDLPKLVHLSLSRNRLTGTLEPLRGCTALRELDVSRNRLTGSLEPLESCTLLHGLDITHNLLTGTLEPLLGCVRLQQLVAQELLQSDMPCNLTLSGGVEPCTALQGLALSRNCEPSTAPAPHGMLRGCTAPRAYLRYDLRQGHAYMRKLVRQHPLVILLAWRVHSRRERI